MDLRSAKYVNNTPEAHVKEPNKKQGKGHAGETSEGHGRDQGKEAHQPTGAAPDQKVPPVQYKHQAHGKEAKKDATRTGPAAQKCDPPTVRQ
jgi:hypothetical protein